MVVIDRVQMLGGLDDVELVLSAQSGDIDAFAALYERYQPHLMRYCRGRLGNWEDAADATQEAFLRAWRVFDAFGGDRRFLPWARTIAANVCTDTLRRRMRSPHTDLPDIDPASTLIAGEEACIACADTEEVHKALARLSERHGEILWLREYEGWSYQDIADREQLDLTAVKSRLWRARHALRREILAGRATHGRLAALGAFVPGGWLGRIIHRGQRLADHVTSLGQGPASNAVATAASSAASATATVSLAFLGGAAAHQLLPPTPVLPRPPAAAVAAPRPQSSPTTMLSPAAWAATLPPRLVAQLPLSLAPRPQAAESGTAPAPQASRPSPNSRPEASSSTTGSPETPETPPTTAAPTGTPTGTTMAPTQP